jgi:hypothetical protein
MKRWYERILLGLIACLVCLLFVVPARSQCCNGNCGGIRVFEHPCPRETPTRYIWKCEPGGTCWGLFIAGTKQQVGAWTAEGGYQSVTYDANGNDAWSKTCEPPAPLPGLIRVYGAGKSEEGKQIESDGTANFGVKRSGVQRTGCHYRLNGKEVGRDEAVQALKAGAPNLPDDSGKKTLTIIGPAESRKQVEADLAGPLAQQASAFRVKSYAPDNWAVARYGFVTSGNPTIYVQNPDGKVLARMDGYRGAAELGEVLSQAMRAKDASYDPAKDPATPNEGPGGGGSQAPHVAFGGLSLLSILAALGKAAMEGT